MNLSKKIFVKYYQIEFEIINFQLCSMVRQNVYSEQIHTCDFNSTTLTNNWLLNFTEKTLILTLQLYVLISRKKVDFGRKVDLGRVDLLYGRSRSVRSKKNDRLRTLECTSYLYKAKANFFFSPDHETMT